MMMDIGIYGLGIMGKNLSLNIENNGFAVSVFNRTVKGVEEDVAACFVNNNGIGKRIFGAITIEEFTESIKRPRKVLLMIRADAVDEAICSLLPHLNQGDILIDGGNSDFRDTERRVRFLQDKGMFFVGAGISGGEEGALQGASVMVGGSTEAWKKLRNIFLAVAAKLPDGRPCCNWVGPGGAGHFVKMVHNGIEYAEMSTIAEAYNIMHELLSMGNEEIARIFEKWNKGKLNSYLISITSKILRKRDVDGGLIIEKILDVAEQKGTGINTLITALELGVPVPGISAAVSTRFFSAIKEERNCASNIYRKSKTVKVEKRQFLGYLRVALLASRIMSFAQGFSLMSAGSVKYNWGLDLAEIACIWQGGCIIKTNLLREIEASYLRNPLLRNILLTEPFIHTLTSYQRGLRRAVVVSTESGIPIPCLTSALSYFNEIRTERLATNLIQAQRDFFGAHGYERNDRHRGEIYHTNWKE